jgi:hypothetical protein
LEPAIPFRIYTVVMDFEGTACATQFRTFSMQHAFQLWLADLDLVGIYGLTDEQRSRLIKAVQEAKWRIKKLQEMQNIWWITITPDDGGTALLHVVETAVLGPPSPGPEPQPFTAPPEIADAPLDLEAPEGGELPGILDAPHDNQES